MICPSDRPEAAYIWANYYRNVIHEFNVILTVHRR